MYSVKYFVFLLIILYTSFEFPQENNHPKLVVGIVIDQMRYDYLYKYEKYYSEDGFKKIMKEGSNFTFAHYDYVPTYTGPGHTSIYTGTVPFYHGIISNDWFNKKTNKFVNCVQDDSVQTVGVKTKEGDASPRRLLTTTISDQMKIATNGKCKVYSISLKDRAAILPGGHAADEVFWYSSESGKFISSTYYTGSLPPWVISFNEKNMVSQLFQGEWDLLLPKENYSVSYPDNAPWEDDVFSEGKTNFPHSFSKIMDKKYDLIRSTPFGNDLLLKFAEALIENEKPGSSGYTDFLAISFSSPDFIGHAYGPNSFEIQDTYIRMDRQIAELLNSLDQNVGKGNYLLFLTADHSVSESVKFLKGMNIPSGNFDFKSCEDSLKVFAQRKFGTSDLIKNFSNLQIYFDQNILMEKNLDESETEDAFAGYLSTEFNQIEKVFVRHNLEYFSPGRIPSYYIVNGFNPERSGNVEFELKPNILPGNESTGTTHGASFPYDTHVPLIFYGRDIPANEINTPVYIVDIAATITNLLGITEPTGCIGIPVIKKIKD